MKKVKQLMAVLLTAAVLMTAVTACGSGSEVSKQTNTSASTAAGNAQQQDTSKEESGSIPKEPMTLTVAFWDIDQALANAEKDQFIQKVQKDLNVTLKPINITWDDYSQKIQMWAASSQLPDIFSIDAIGTQYYRNWTQQGVVKPLPEDLSKYPTLEKYMSNPDIQALKQDGKLYCVPRGLYDSLDYCAHDRNVWYRWDLAQKAGITKEPETWEEFKSMLTAIVKADPEKKKIGGMTAVNVKQLGGFFWLYSNPAAMSDGSGSDFKWIKEDGKYIPAAFSKNTLPSLENARDMYEKGLIDKDIALVKGQEGYDKFASGKVAALLEVGYDNVSTKMNERWKKLYPDTHMLDSVKRVKYFPATDGTKYHAVFRTFWSESYFSGKIDEKKLDRILMLYDYFLKPETKESYRFGVRDVDYAKEGDKIKTLISLDELKKKQPSLEVIQGLVEFDNQFQYDPNNFTLDPRVVEIGREDMEVVRKETKIPEYQPQLTYVSTPTKDKFTIMDHDFLLNIMMGNKPVGQMWENVKKEYEAKGLSRMIDEVNAKAKEAGIN